MCDSLRAHPVLVGGREPHVALLMRPRLPADFYPRRLRRTALRVIILDRARIPEVATDTSSCVG